ncbi:MAG: class I SAM-dependent methyltransferase [Anaerolineae bacterium]|nr:class I SAM-dependent methyltransferase [Anaerolineae bacterium]
MNPDNAETRALRTALVDSLKQKGELADPLLEAAFRAVPRHYFLSDLTLEEIYSDEALPVKRDSEGGVLSSSSQPMMMAMMLRQLQVQPGQNVLEIGAGTGYNAAIMQYVVGRDGNVTTLELDHDLAEQAERSLQRAGAFDVRVVLTDGAGGYAPRAAYDRIIATAGVWDIPKAWVTQLKPRGIIVAPLWIDAMQVSAALQVQGDDRLYSESNLPCGLIHLRSVGAGPEVTRRVGNSPLVLTSNDVPAVDGAALYALLADGVEDSLLDIRLSGSEYFHGFLPYLVLNLPEGFTFAAYNLSANQQVYGIDGSGLALIRAGSACFVPFQGHGAVQSFGSPDALLAVQDTLVSWDAAGRPDWQALRLRLYPKTETIPAVSAGKLYTRQDYFIHAWQDIP